MEQILQKCSRHVLETLALHQKRWLVTLVSGEMVGVSDGSQQIFFPGFFVLIYSVMLRNAYRAPPAIRNSSNERPIDGWNRVMMTCWIVIGCELIPSVWANYVTHERASGSKMHQHSAGIPLLLYWFGEIVWDATIFLISGFIVILAQVWVIPEPFVRFSPGIT